jgi:uncharacterized protein (DUF2236 family)
MESSLHAEPASLVSRSQSEALAQAIESAALARTGGDRRAGIFGPRTMMWRLSREAALFLGAGRAALLQLAHPWVATAIEQHSNVMSLPIARFHNTFRIVFAMIFGSLDQALAAARYLYALHTRIRGEMPEDIGAYPRGSHYEANEIAALRWVYATLVESAVVAYESVMPPLTARELNEYFAEWRTLAALFGLSSSILPEDWPAFLSYCRGMEQSNALGVSATSRTMAHNLLAGAGSWIKTPHWYRALTTEWLPERFRVEFDLKFDSTDQEAAERAKKKLPGYYGRLPAAIRFVGPWHEARARLNGNRVGTWTGVSNRFWIGAPRLPFADKSTSL